VHAIATASTEERTTVGESDAREAARQQRVPFKLQGCAPYLVACCEQLLSLQPQRQYKGNPTGAPAVLMRPMTLSGTATRSACVLESQLVALQRGACDGALHAIYRERRLVRSAQASVASLERCSVSRMKCDCQCNENLC
jgi:hypothetical protein